MSNRGSVIAIALAALAFVTAATGTAVAVATSQVTITDPVTPAHIARVDSTGRLSVNAVGVTSTIDANGLLYNLNSQDNFLTSPTTAALAITKISLSEASYDSSGNNPEVRVFFYKVGTDSSGNCASSGYVLLGIYHLNAGDDIVDPFTAPLLVQATAGAKYCLDFYVYGLAGAPGLSYFPTYQLTGYVSSGTYKGIGLSTAPAAHPARKGRDTAHK